MNVNNSMHNIINVQIKIIIKIVNNPLTSLPLLFFFSRKERGGEPSSHAPLSFPFKESEETEKGVPSAYIPLPLLFLSRKRKKKRKGIAFLLSPLFAFEGNEKERAGLPPLSSLSPSRKGRKGDSLPPLSALCPSRKREGESWPSSSLILAPFTERKKREGDSLPPLSPLCL